MLINIHDISNDPKAVHLELNVEVTQWGNVLV